MPPIARTLICLIFFVCFTYANTLAQYTGTAPHCHEYGGLVINEMSQGPGEYVEFVVVGAPGDPTAPVDLSGWIIDDNNLNQSGVGTAEGHLIFGAGYNAVPPGSIIVVYENNPANPSLPPVDPYDANGDNVYIASHNQNNSFDLCYSNPSTSTEYFCPCPNLNDPTQGLVWMCKMANDNDMIQIRDNCETVVHVVSYQLNASEVTTDISSSPVWVELNPGGQSGSVISFMNSVNDDWSNPANFVSAPIAGNETPGAANSPENQAFIDAVAAGTFPCNGIVASCDQTDAGDLALEDDTHPGYDPGNGSVDICQGDDLDNFTVSWTGSEPNASGFNFEYGFLLVEPGTGNIVDFIISPNPTPYYGDFDFSGYPSGTTLDIYGFSYFHSNTENTLLDFMTEAPFNISTVADILSYSDCGYAGDLSPFPLVLNVGDPLATAIDPASGFCTGGQYTLDGTPSGGSGIYTHTWTDGVAGVLQSPFDQSTVNIDLTGIAPGTNITITHTVTDDNGCTQNDDISFTVGGDDVVFDYSVAQACAPTSGSNTINVNTNPPTAGGTYTVDPATGLTVDAASGEITLDNGSVADSYTITYEVDDGTCVSSHSVSFEVQTSVELLLDDPIVVCEGGDLDVNATVTSGDLGSFEWELDYIAGTIPGGSGSDADVLNIMPSLADDGATISVSFSPDNPAVCGTSVSGTISVVSAPQAPDPVTDDVLIYCTGASIEPITVNFVAGNTVEWYEDAALTAPALGTGDTYTPSFDITYDPTETYPLTLEVYVIQYDPANPDCVSPPGVIEITINEGQQAALNYYGAVFCEGMGVIDLRDEFQIPSGNPDGIWSGDPNISGNNFDIAAAGPGTYTLEFIEANDCASPSNPLTIQVVEDLDGTVTPEVNVCPEQTPFPLNDYLLTGPTNGYWTDESGAVVVEYDPALYGATHVFTYTLGACTFPGTFGICPAVFDPVCGCDLNTYGNECEAIESGVFYFVPGECDGFQLFDYAGCELVLTMTVNQDSAPTIDFAPTYTLCAGDYTVDLFADPLAYAVAPPATNGSWTGIGVDALGNFDVAAAWGDNPDITQPLDVVVNLAYTDPCPFDEDLSITLTPPADLSPLQEFVCDGQLVDLNFVYPPAPGQIVLWYSEDPDVDPTSFIDISDYAFYPDANQTLYLSVTENGSDCTSVTTLDITFSDLDGFGIIDEFHCSGQELDLSIFEPQLNTAAYDGAFTWYDESPSDNPAATPLSDLLVIPTDNPTVYYSIFEQDVTGCQAAGTVVLTVQASQLVEFTDPEILICDDGTDIDLNDWLVTSYLGSEWSGDYTSTNGDLDVAAAIAAGDTSFDVTYSTGSNNCDDTQSITVNIVEGANPSWDAPTAFCHTAAFGFDSYVTGDPGGIWTDQDGNELDPIADEFLFEDLTASEDFDITYSIAGSVDCPPASQTWTIPVFLNHVLVNNPINLCGDELIIDLNDASIIVGDTNGDWSYDGSPLVGSTFNPSLYGDGPSYELTFTPPSFPACEELILTVNVADPPDWTETVTVCAEGGDIDLDTYLPTGAPSGVWSDFDPAIELTGSLFTNAADWSGQVVEFYYDVPDTEPCADRYTLFMSIEAELNPSLTPANICYEPGSVDLNDLMAPDPPGGNWFVDGDPLSFGTLTPTNYDANANIEISYQLDAIGDCPEPDPALETVSFSIPTEATWETFSICQDDEPVNLQEQLEDPTLAGTWLGNGVTGTIFDPAADDVETGFVDVLFTPDDTGGACSPEPFTQAILVLDTLDITVGDIQVCEWQGFFNLTNLVNGIPNDLAVTWEGSCVLDDGITFDPSGFGGQTMTVTGTVYNVFCVDPTMIDETLPCPAVVAPVCGCDGITYNNDCEAINYGGILDYTDGACPYAPQDCIDPLVVDIFVDPCILCPVIESIPVDQTLCAGDAASLTIVVDDPFLADIRWTDPLTGDLLGFAQTYDLGILENNTCAPISQFIDFAVICLEDGSTIEQGTVEITVYPSDIQSFVNPVGAGECTTSVEIDPSCEPGFLQVYDPSQTGLEGTSGTHEYTVEVTYPLGLNCTGDFTVEVPYECEALCPSDPTAGSSATEVCTGGFFSLEASMGVGSDEEVTYSWTSDISGAVADPAAVSIDLIGCDPVLYTFTLTAICDGEESPGEGNETVQVLIYPAVPEPVIIQSAGCGESSSAIIFGIDDGICAEASTAVPANPPCDSGLTNEESVDYSFVFFEGTICETTYEGTLVAACEAVACTECPSTIDAPQTAEVCSGEAPIAPTPVLIGDNGNQVEWYQGDALTGTPFGSYDFGNDGCDPTSVTFNAFILCDEDEDPGTAETYTDLLYTFTVNIAPAQQVALELPGGCGQAATVQFISEDGQTCGEQQGTVPVQPDCGTGLDDNQPLPYTFTGNAGTACEYQLTGTVLADCFAQECTDCPSTTDPSGSIEICSGTQPLLPEISLQDENGFAVEWFEGDAQTGTPLNAVDFSNTGCEALQISLSAFILCDADENPATAEEYIDLQTSQTITVYPEALTANPNTAGCDIAASVEFLSADGSSCLITTAPIAPSQPACDEPADEQSLNYNETFFPGTLCEQSFEGFVEASCPSVPCAGCPSTVSTANPTDICAGDVPTLPALVIDEGNGNDVEWFLGNPDTGQAFADVDLSNLTCAEASYTLNAYIACDVDNDINTPDELVPLGVTWTLTVFPTELTGSSTDGGCGVPASLLIVSGDGSVCYTQEGLPPIEPACGEADADESQSVEAIFFEGTICQQTITLSAAAICPAPACPTCPYTEDPSSSSELCSGDVPAIPDPVLLDPNGEPVVWYQGNPDTGTAFEDLSFSNNSCETTEITLNAFVLCDDDGDPLSPANYVDLEHSHLITLFPAAFTVSENVGACGAAATAVLFSADGLECETQSGAIPTNPICDSGIDSEEPLDYNFTYFTGTSCEQSIAGTVQATCPAEACTACPSTSDTPSSQDICSGEAIAVPELNLIDDNEEPIQWFLGDPDTGTALADISTENNSCDMQSFVVNAYILCDADEDPNTPLTIESLSFGHTVNLYPAPLVATPTPGACDLAATVLVLSAAGDQCDFVEGIAPVQPECGSGLTDDQSLSYEQVFFPDSPCPSEIALLVPAQCESVECLTCPGTSDPDQIIELCTGDVLDFAPVALVDDNGNPVEWFEGDPDTGTPAADLDLSNQTCDTRLIDLTAFILCDDDGDSNTDEIYIPLGLEAHITVFPDLLTETVMPGGCELAGSVQILAADGTLCTEAEGDVPATPECDSGITEDATWTYFTTFFSETSCEQVFEIEVPAFCVAVDCTSCPNTADPNSAAELCSGDLINPPILNLEDENTFEPEWFVGDPATGVALADVSTQNATCQTLEIVLNAYILCDVDEDPGTQEEYIDLVYSHTLTIYPEQFSAVETIGDCGIDAMVEFVAGDGSLCLDEVGTSPDVPECDSGITNTAVLDYNPTFFAGSICEYTLGGTIISDCAAVPCTNCPSTSDPDSTGEICSGDAITTPLLNISDPNGNEPAWFAGDPDSGTALADIDTQNTGCTELQVELSAYILCDLDEDPGTADEFVELSYTHTVTIYPETFTETVTIGACGQAASVLFLAGDGSECGGETGNIPVQPECDSGLTDIQDLNYATVFFEGSICEFTMQGGIAAACEAVPCSECPSTNDVPDGESICDGDAPTLPNLSLNNANNNAVEWFEGDPDTGTALDNIDFGLTGCESASITVSAYILCDVDEDPDTPDQYVNLNYTHTVDVYAVLDGSTTINDCNVELSIACPDWAVSWEALPSGATGSGTSFTTTTEGEAGTVTFTISDPSSPIECGTLTIDAAYTCSSCAADASINSPASLCEGDVLDLSSLITGDAGGTWSTDAPAGTIIDDNIFTSDGLAGQSFSITYTVSTDPDCSDSQSVNISIDDLAIIEAGADQVICADEVLSLNGSFTGASPVTWSGGAGSFSSPNSLNSSYTPDASDPESFYLTLSASDDCGSYIDSMMVTLLPADGINLGATITIQEGESIELPFAGTGDYIWTDPQNTLNCTDCPNPIASPLNPTTYTVVSSNGCSEGSIFVNVLQTPRILIPNAFSPNGDGTNDQFRVTSVQVETIEWFVFDRWGKLLYSATSLSEAWDGTYKGEAMPIGVYVYYANFNYIGEETQMAKGNLTLVR